jgi:hypothetical protein
MKIYAPVKDFNGMRNNVRFVNGVGETDDPKLIAWFDARGYTVEMSDKRPQNSVEKSEDLSVPLQIDEVEMMGYSEKTPNFEDMTPNELREWAKANGLGGVIKNTRNKEKLLELIRG